MGEDVKVYPTHPPDVYRFASGVRPRCSPGLIVLVERLFSTGTHLLPRPLPQILHSVQFLVEDLRQGTRFRGKLPQLSELPNPFVHSRLDRADPQLLGQSECIPHARPSNRGSS